MNTVIRRLLRLFASRTVTVHTSELAGATVVDETHQWAVVDAEDHGPERTSTEELMLANQQVRAAAREQIARVHGVDPVLLVCTVAGCGCRDVVADDAHRRAGGAIGGTRPPFPGDEPQRWVWEGNRWRPVTAEELASVADWQRQALFTADELAADVAAYEAGAADRARRAGLSHLWPAAPAPAQPGMCRPADRSAR